MAALAKDCHALTSYFEKKYKEKYNRTPNLNRYAARWGFDSVLASMDARQAKQLLDYYLTTQSARAHDLEWFFWNYSKLVQAMIDTKEDIERRKVLKEESRARAEKWRQSGKQSVTDA